jgi:hypothetical protein
VIPYCSSGNSYICVKPWIWYMLCISESATSVSTCLQWNGFFKAKARVEYMYLLCCQSLQRFADAALWSVVYVSDLLYTRMSIRQSILTYKNNLVNSISELNLSAVRAVETEAYLATDATYIWIHTLWIMEFPNCFSNMDGKRATLKCLLKTGLRS